jgi:predicted permease
VSRIPGLRRVFQFQRRSARVLAADVDEELAFHLDLRAAELMAQRGFTPDAARAEALRQFGDLDDARRYLRALDARTETAARRRDLLDTLRQDLRLALRTLRRAPGFATVAVLCLALGIGANTAVFSVVNAVLLRPPPVAEPDRLVRLWEAERRGGGYGSVSFPNYRDWAREARAFTGLAAYHGRSLTLGGAGEPERVQAVAATANVFRVLGVQPLLGRAFAPGEDAPDRPAVVVLSEGIWRRRFGADPAVVGRTIPLDTATATVVGVMPAALSARLSPVGADLWVPYRPSPEQAAARGDKGLSVLGRLGLGVTLEQAAAQLRAVAARLERAYPETQTNTSARVVPLRDDVVGGARRPLGVLLGAVALVLVIACANVAGLLLARASARRPEVAVRLALGASRAALVRQFLVEGLVLSFAGAAVGAALAWAGLRVLAPLAAGALPVADDLTLDGRVLAALAGVAMLSGVAVSLVPALRASAPGAAGRLTGALGGQRTTVGGDQQRARGALVVAELAFSLVLLVGAGLLLRGFVALRGTPSGLVTAHVLTAHVPVPAGRYPPGTGPTRLVGPVLERVRAIPGVRSAGAISLLPVQSAWTWGNFTVEGRLTPAPDDAPSAELRLTSPGVFRSLGIPVRAGRDFTDADGHPGARVVIVNEALAREALAGADPLGQRLRRTGEVYTVVGVVGDVRQAGLDQAPHPELHFPSGDSTAAAAPWVPDHLTLVVRTAGPPAAVAAAVRDAARAVDPGAPVFDVQTMDAVVTRSLGGRRLTLYLLGSFAGVALALAAAGLYGVIAYLVAQRTRELGVRVALGARPGDVVRLVLWGGARLTALGVGLGLVGALALSRLLEGLLYGVGARDPLTFAAVPVVLAGVALLAAYVPARRAGCVDPLLAIRGE